MTATQPVADRLEFHFRESGDPAWPLAVVCVEDRPRKPVVTGYRVAPGAPSEYGRFFKVARGSGYETDRRGVPAGGPYTVFLGSDGTTLCDCPGASYRRQECRCRHILLAEHLIAEGAV